LPHYQKTVASGEVQSFVVQSRRRIGSRTVECTAIPIKNEMGRVIKVLSVSNDITERKKAEDDLLQKNIELRQLSAHLENIREEERTKMSREIHDELGQQLTGLKMEVSWLNRHFKGQDQKTLLKIKSCLGLIDDTIQSVKRIATMLRPSILDHLGLAEALDWQGAEFSKHTGVPLSFQTAVSETKFPPVLSIAVFRVFQEALTNVARHANATEVSCTLKVESGTLHLIVTDNGKGFSTQSWTQRRTLGLLGMRERVEMLHGRFTIHSVPGEGTTICAEIPLN
ncbi:MAG TPA: sensor histidine kinase, partial [Flavisolibacter sp.]